MKRGPKPELVDWDVYPLSGAQADAVKKLLRDFAIAGGAAAGAPARAWTRVLKAVQRYEAELALAGEPHKKARVGRELARIRRKYGPDSLGEAILLGRNYNWREQRSSDSAERDRTLARGRPANEALDTLVGELIGTYEKLTGQRPTVSWRARANPEKHWQQVRELGGGFGALLKICVRPEYLADHLPRATDSAIKHAMNRVMKARRSSGQ